MTCDAPHPERPEVHCALEGTHADHSTFVKGEGHVRWPNTSFVMAPRVATVQKVTEVKKDFLDKAREVGREKRSKPLDLAEVMAPRQGLMHSLPHDTEAAAAYAILPHTGTQRWTVLQFYIDHPDGSTDEKMRQHIGIRYSSQNARRRELVQGGWVEDSGRREATTSGQPAIVWTLTAEGRERLAAAGLLPV